jgi:nitric-oxide synthase
VAGLAARHPDATFVVCGPESYQNEVRGHLLAAGVASAQVVVEAFAPTGRPPVVPPEARKPALPPVCPVDHASLAATLDAPLSPREEARLLVTQMHAESGLAAALPARLAALERAGPFEPQEEELAFAARVAWRNSTRCIGRLYWKGLLVRDRRTARHPGAMLDEMVEHMRIATNGGRLRSVLTVFDPVDTGTPRIVSPQLVRYAGYRNADGSVTGDPAHVELTALAQAHGWKGEGRAFDVLPLMVRGEDGRLYLRALDPVDVLEVSLTHPQYAWFAALGLRWHALPAIAEVCLDAFGRLFPVVFNGWYMGTEIGARNLSDPYRYDLLPELAKRLGLDRRSEATLWRDRALVELNVAVLHSFQQAGVTMLDHHTDSKEFVDFVAAEHGCGRPIQAEWSWIVPPISGSATPQFHIDFTNQRYKPAFVARPE